MIKTATSDRDTIFRGDAGSSNFYKLLMWSPLKYTEHENVICDSGAEYIVGFSGVVST